MDQQLRNSSVNARERRQIQALEKIAAHLEGISTTLGLWYARTFPDCEPLPPVSESTPEKNDEAAHRVVEMLHGVERKDK